LWNKREEGMTSHTQPEPMRSPVVAGPVSPVAASPALAPRPQTAPVQRPPSAAIGASMYIKGDISTREELLVDGEVEGTVESHSLLTVGPKGRVRANIKAREVVVFGSVEGDVEVSEKISVRGEGSVVGNIKAAGIGIDDGAYFKGSIDIVRPEPPARRDVEAKAQ
jgi:cytoskeletal protein CcmA (bactofilin family)